MKRPAPPGGGAKKSAEGSCSCFSCSEERDEVLLLGVVRVVPPSEQDMYC